MRISCMCTALEVVQDADGSICYVAPECEPPKGGIHLGWVLPEHAMPQRIGQQQLLSDVPNVGGKAAGEPKECYPNFDLAKCDLCGARVAVGA